MSDGSIVLRVVGLACRAVDGLGCGSRIAPLFARIQDLAPDARTDHAGELIRFADRGLSASVRARIAEAGYRSEELTGSARSDTLSLSTRWYAPSDLSREEAQALADQIVPAFARERSIDPREAPALRELVQGALFGCFTAVVIPSSAPLVSLPATCREAVALAAAALLGSDAATALGRLVERRLASA
jgi:hypothetical protein